MTSADRGAKVSFSYYDPKHVADMIGTYLEVNL
jgi:hypothetical protein